MLMAIIEYELNPGHDSEYLGLIEMLAPHLEQIDGFLSADAATSLQREGRQYEISYWRDAEALTAWSNESHHQKAKAVGREKILKWYRITIGAVERDWEVGTPGAT